MEEDPGLQNLPAPAPVKHLTHNSDAGSDAEIEESIQDAVHRSSPVLRTATETLLNLGDSDEDVPKGKKSVSPVKSPSPLPTSQNPVNAAERSEPGIAAGEKTKSGRVIKIVDRNAVAKNKRNKLQEFRPNKERHFNSESHEFHVAAVRESRANAMRLVCFFFMFFQMREFF